jgi:hypothetical protein
MKVFSGTYGPTEMKEARVHAGFLCQFIYAGDVGPGIGFGIGIGRGNGGKTGPVNSRTTVACVVVACAGTIVATPATSARAQSTRESDFINDLLSGKVESTMVHARARTHRHPIVVMRAFITYRPKMGVSENFHK